MKKELIALGLVTLACTASTADEDGSTIMTKAEVEATIAQGMARLAEGRTVSDIVMRHIDVGESNFGVSMVQRSKVEANGVETGIAHVNLDEIYYVVEGEGIMVTGGEFVDPQSTDSNLLGAMLRGEISGGVLQPVKSGDIAIIPKGMPHGWHEIHTDTISYLIFRGDPEKEMAIKSEQ
ncbi:MAG: hypothetical protein MI746_16005 [Pseudomonadales bacterium]|nr:hypothetical protein [Pseudomonadales bacterium]